MPKSNAQAPLANDDGRIGRDGSPTAGLDLRPRPKGCVAGRGPHPDLFGQNDRCLAGKRMMPTLDPMSIDGLTLAIMLANLAMLVGLFLLIRNRRAN